MISILKIIGFAFGVLMSYATFLSYKKKEINKVHFIFWEIVWVSMLFVVIFTNLTTEAVKAMGFIRVMDFLTVAGFIIIILLSFYNYSSVNKIKRQLEEKIREDSLKHLKK
jgi:hypothetical protein